MLNQVDEKEDNMMMMNDIFIVMIYDYMQIYWF